MEEMVSLWSYQENIDEMNQKLMYAILELEKLKLDASEESRKNKEYVKQLIQLLNITIQERDEARNQLQKLLEKFMLTSSNESSNILPQIHVDNPLLKPRKTNSSINESTQSNISSPVDLLFDAVSSPEFSNFNMLSTNQVTSGVPKIFNMLSTNQVPSGVPKIDCASLIIDNLVKGRVLPQTGKLLRAVVEAGPLLQTLLVAGPLPRWQNPPRLQPFQIPPAPIKGYDQENFAQMSCGSSQISSAPMLNFANVPQGSSLHNGLMMSTSTNAYSCIPLANSHSFCRKFEGYPPSNLSMHEPGGGTELSDWNPWVMVSVAVVCIITLFFSCFRILQRQCTPFLAVNLLRNSVQRRRLDEIPEASPSLQYESRGLNSYIMHSIPVTHFEKHKDGESCAGNTDCAVCLGEFEEGQWVKHLPNCSHVFHVSCIDTWFQTHSSCPLCRSFVYNPAMQHECSVSIYSL